MSYAPGRPGRWMTTVTWPAGIVLTSWDYMWRSTVLHRREELVEGDAAWPPPSFPEGVSRTDLLPADRGHGPMFHRRYRTAIRNAATSPEELMTRIQSDVNCVAPTKFARFVRLADHPGPMRVGDDYLVRMPGPWDGPVRVIDRDDRSFRLATLIGHLEAGQIEFRTWRETSLLHFEIESWARSSSVVTNLLYHHLRMAKEVQFHMWISFLEKVVALSSGRMTGGIEVITQRMEYRADA